jgi:predicted DNA-binding protein with PD1-like motif
MKGQSIGDQGGKTYAVIFETGDEVVSGLLEFAQQNQLAGSHFTAIGAFSRVVLGYFDIQARDYQKIPIDEQVEVLTLAGDIALKDEEPMVHAHAVVGKRDGTAHGGHLVEAQVRPTLEVILVESPIHLHRRFDAETGLALINL